MTKLDARRIVTSDGALLLDRGCSELGPEPSRVLDPSFWAARGQLQAVDGGRGAAWFVAGGRWVLRHYRRGGLIARLSQDRYVWAGERRVRAFAEWRLLADLARRGLPVPKPIAAGYQRRGLVYRCDLITERIAGTHSLSALLLLAPLPQQTWRAVGAAVARLHAVGADHADLNAHNILVDTLGGISVIDFDRGRLRSPADRVGWTSRNLARLQRSLRKVTRLLPPDRHSAETWAWLLAGYASVSASASG